MISRRHGSQVKQQQKISPRATAHDSKTQRKLNALRTIKVDKSLFKLSFIDYFIL